MNIKKIILMLLYLASLGCCIAGVLLMNAILAGASVVFLALWAIVKFAKHKKQG